MSWHCLDAFEGRYEDRRVIAIAADRAPEIKRVLRNERHRLIAGDPLPEAKMNTRPCRFISPPAKQCQTLKKTLSTKRSRISSRRRNKGRKELVDNRQHSDPRILTVHGTLALLAIRSTHLATDYSRIPGYDGRIVEMVPSKRTTQQQHAHGVCAPHSGRCPCAGKF